MVDQSIAVSCSEPGSGASSCSIRESIDGWKFSWAILYLTNLGGSSVNSLVHRLNSAAFLTNWAPGNQAGRYCTPSLAYSHIQRNVAPTCRSMVHSPVHIREYLPKLGHCFLCEFVEGIIPVRRHVVPICKIKHESDHISIVQLAG